MAMQSIWTANSDRDLQSFPDEQDLNRYPALEAHDVDDLEEEDPAVDAIENALELAREQEEASCHMTGAAARRMRKDAGSLRRMARNACRSGRYLSTVDALAHRL